MTTTTTSTIENDNNFLDLVKNGYFSVKSDGTVINSETGYSNWSVNCGYRKVHYKNKSILLHRLVYLAHKGTIPLGMVINHIDGVKLNNCISNLEVVTETENIHHAIKTGLVPSPTEEHKLASSERSKGQLNLNSHFLDKDVLNLRTMFLNGRINMDYICSKYGVTTRSAKNMLNGVTYSHVPGAITKNTRIKK